MPISRYTYRPTIVEDRVNLFHDAESNDEYVEPEAEVVPVDDSDLVLGVLVIVALGVAVGVAVGIFLLILVLIYQRRLALSGGCVYIINIGFYSKAIDPKYQWIYL